MTFENADAVLEHFGVKGMHWGVRKQRITSSDAGGEKKTTSKKKRAAQIAVVAGVVVAAAVIAHKSGVRLRAPQNAPRTALGKAEAERLIAKLGQQKFSAIPMPPVKTPSRPKVSARSGLSEVAALRASIGKTIKEANIDLRERDNRLQIPFPERSYLTEWD